MKNFTEAENYIFVFTKMFAKTHFDTEVSVGFLRPQTHRLLGQCDTRQKVIRYNRKFIEAHKDNKKILEYLAIHECCHLKESFHDSKFKRLCKKHGLPHHRIARIDGYISTEPTRYYLIKCPKCDREEKALKFKAFGACMDCCTKYNGGKYKEDYRFTFIKYVDELKGDRK